MKIDLSNKSPKQLLSLIDKVKVSDLSFNEKTELIKEIEFKLYGKRDINYEALKTIEESQLDLDDLKWGENEKDRIRKRRLNR